MREGKRREEKRREKKIGRGKIVNLTIGKDIQMKNEECSSTIHTGFHKGVQGSMNWYVIIHSLPSDSALV